MTDPVLSDADIASLTWSRLEAHIERRIAALSRENENPEHGEVQTNLRRGQIKAFRELLRLAKPPQSQDSLPGQ